MTGFVPVVFLPIGAGVPATSISSDSSAGHDSPTCAIATCKILPFRRSCTNSTRSMMRINFDLRPTGSLSFHGDHPFFVCVGCLFADWDEMRRLAEYSGDRIASKVATNATATRKTGRSAGKPSFWCLTCVPSICGARLILKMRRAFAV
jgi:hypothetical protein